MKEITQAYQIIKSKRQLWNLKRLLTRAKFNETQESPKVTKCNRPNCGVCAYLITNNYFRTGLSAVKHLRLKRLCHVTPNVLYSIIRAVAAKKNILEKRMTLSVTDLLSIDNK